jgi:hypothetical protein
MEQKNYTEFCVKRYCQERGNYSCCFNGKFLNCKHFFEKKETEDGKENKR